MPLPDSTIWEVLLGPAKGAMVRSALSLLVAAGVTPEEISAAIQAIDRETAIGPLTNPTAYLDGRRFDNAREYIDTLRALHALTVALTPSRDAIKEVRS